MKHIEIPLVLATILASTGLVGCDLFSSDDDGKKPDPITYVIDYYSGAPDNSIEWGPEVVVTAFTPAQRSWQWLVRQYTIPDDSHPTRAVTAIRSGQNCVSCHDGSDGPTPTEIGATLVGADADPVPGKVGTRNILIQAAYTADKFYLKTSWQTQQARPAASHDLYTLQGDAWSVVGKNKPAPLDDGGYDVYSSEDRISLQFIPVSKGSDTPTEPAVVASQANLNSTGCWSSCHSDMSNMPDSTDKSKYLLSSRVGGLTGGDTDSQVALDALRDAGQFPDMWHFRGARAAAVQSLTDGYVLDTRAGDDGLDVFSSNNLIDGHPTWMYDSAIMGFNAVSRDEWDANLQNTPPLIIDGPAMNAVAYDPAAVFEDGSFIPRRVLTSTPVVGSRTDVKSYSKWENGTWTVIFERARDTGNPDDHALDPTTENYTLAFAIHDDNVSGRWHHVSFPLTLGMEGTGANIEARFND